MPRKWSRHGSAWSRPNNLTNVDGTLFFLADDGSDVWKLWQSDGTAAGTALVTDLAPSSLASGSTMTIEVALASAAPVGGVSVMLASSKPAVVLPTSILVVPAGARHQYANMAGEPAVFVFGAAPAYLPAAS